MTSALRTFEVGPALFVVTVSGDADGGAAAALAGELWRRHTGSVIVDLLQAHNVGPEIHDALGYARARITVVAQPHVLHALELSGRDVRLASSLSTAVAAEL
jgi:hypothetical protein